MVFGALVLMGFVAFDLGELTVFGISSLGQHFDQFDFLHISDYDLLLDYLEDETLLHCQ
jgi:hypothetical protein